MSAVLTEEQIRERLVTALGTRPNDPAWDYGFSFGEGLSLSQEAAVFNDVRDRGGTMEEAQEASLRAAEAVMRIARQLEDNDAPQDAGATQEP